MTTRPLPIGFHFGSEATATGYGDYIRTLDAAGVPAVLMSVGGEGFGDIVGVWDGGSTVDHLAVIRCLSHNDVPLYGAPIDTAVNEWLNRYVPTIGNDVKKYHQRVITKHGNELDKNRIQWLADFYTALHPALLARMGWSSHRIACFSFASGEPEPEQWETILPFIELAGNNPDKFVFSLHEYSYNVGNIWSGAGHLIGRFKQLYDICDAHGIKRPHVVSHEWGWEENEMPPTQQAMIDIDEVAAMYASYPTYLGAGIWTLQKWHETNYLSNKVQKLIGPVKQLALTKQYEVNEELPMPDKPKIVILKKPQKADMTEAENEAANQRAWNDYGRTTTHSHDDMLTMLAAGNDESYAVVCWPDRQPGVIQLLEGAGYNWIMFPEEAPPRGIEIINIVDDLPKHPTKKYLARPLSGITTLTVHHTVSPPDRSIESIANYHVNSNGWPGIGYGFVIKDDGRIYQTNHLTTKSYHAGSAAAPGDENAISVGIALQGDFTNNAPPKAQQDAARALVTYLKRELPSVTAVLGHRQMPGAATQCPGNTHKSWLPYVAGGEIEEHPPPVPPTPLPGKQVNIRKYFEPTGEYGRKYVFRFPDGSTQPQQLRKMPDGTICLFKGDGQTIDGKFVYDYERFYFDAQGDLRRKEDTSVGGRAAYDQNNAIWLPAVITEGVTYVNHLTLTNYDRVSCKKLGEIQTVDYLKFVKFYPTWTSPQNANITLQNVCQLEWRKSPGGKIEETYYLAEGILYGSWNNGAIYEWADGQQNINGKLWDCVQ